MEHRQGVSRRAGRRRSSRSADRGAPSRRRSSATRRGRVRHQAGCRRGQCRDGAVLAGRRTSCARTYDGCSMRDVTFSFSRTRPASTNAAKRPCSSSTDGTATPHMGRAAARWRRLRRRGGAIRAGTDVRDGAIVGRARSCRAGAGCGPIRPGVAAVRAGRSGGGGRWHPLLLELELAEPSMFLAHAPHEAVTGFARSIVARRSGHG